MSRMTKTELSMRKYGTWATLALLGLGLVLVALEFIVSRKGNTAPEDLVLFPAVFGFLAFLAIVLGGLMVRRLLMRGENYYD